MTEQKLGSKYTCYSCQTRFYDMSKPVPLCPKCGADQRESAEAEPADEPMEEAVEE